jgi:hypothetical protein
VPQLGHATIVPAGAVTQSSVGVLPLSSAVRLPT